jgi:hypothetical protein
VRALFRRLPLYRRHPPALAITPLLAIEAATADVALPGRALRCVGVAVAAARVWLVCCGSRRRLVSRRAGATPCGRATSTGPGQPLLRADRAAAGARARQRPAPLRRLGAAPARGDRRRATRRTLARRDQRAAAGRQLRRRSSSRSPSPAMWGPRVTIQLGRNSRIGADADGGRGDAIDAMSGRLRTDGFAVLCRYPRSSVPSAHVGGLDA